MNTETIKACVSALGVLIVACAGMFGFDVDAGMVQNGLSISVHSTLYLRFHICIFRLLRQEQKQILLLKPS